MIRRRLAQALLLGLSTLGTAVSAAAEDAVTIRYLSGYPLPTQSIERLDVRVTRHATRPSSDDREVDRFFSMVQATLSQYGVRRDWQLVIPDAPYIEITVEVDGRRTRLASAHVVLERTGDLIVTERGVESLNHRTREAVLSQQSEEYRRHRVAIEQILWLTLARVRAQLSP